MDRRLFLISAASAALLACGSNDSSRSASENQRQAQRQARDLGVDPEQVSPDALRAAVTDEQVRQFYERRNWQPAWNHDNAAALLAGLDEAPRHALSKDRFFDQSGNGDPVALEAELSKAALDYGGALAKGLTDPSEIREIYTLARPDIDVGAGLAQAVGAGQVGEWLGSLPPQSREYRALSEAYVNYARQAASGESQEIADGDLIRAGDTDERVPNLVEALQSNGYLGQLPQKRENPRQYTQEVASAVERMQNDYGISADGIVGPETLQVLNTGARDRARQLAINLERLRWLERNPPQTRVDVNTAAAHLDYWRDGQHRDHRRVVVGQPDWETPALGSPMFRLVANPTWTVPKSIEEEEIAEKGPGYLRRNNMVRRDGWIVQQPGPDNALGQVKFDMQNDHSIYLHDTPAKHLFQQNQRQLSHGCVRVENALSFARMIAQHDGIAPEFEEAFASGEETFVDLNSDIPVRLLYHTAFLDRSGQVRFRTDAYGWDEDIASAIGREQRERRRLRTHVRDIGP